MVTGEIYTLTITHPTEEPLVISPISYEEANDMAFAFGLNDQSYHFELVSLDGSECIDL